MASNSLGSAWSSMKIITGLQNTREGTNVILKSFSSSINFTFINCFYNRFDMFDFSKEIQELKLVLCDDQHFSVSQEDVEKAFFCTKVNKKQESR